MSPIFDQHLSFRSTCRACGSPLQVILQLGGLHGLKLNAFPDQPHGHLALERVPHWLTACTVCSLVQLAHTVDPERLYREYWYRSGVNEEMRAELWDVVAHALSLTSLIPTDAVLDIGANDGTLLRTYRTILGTRSPIRFAVEPARNLQEALAQEAEAVIHTFFPAPELQGSPGYFRIITAIAMAYDLEDPTAFFAECRRLLHPEGVLILQFQDFAGMLACAAFDNIVPEHLEYYTVGSLLRILRSVGLDAVEVQSRRINGGSLRVVVRHAGWVMKHLPSTIDTVQAFLALEQRLGLAVADIALGQWGAFTTFAQRVDRAIQQIRATVEVTLEQGAILDVIGASTKGNVTLQVLELGPKEVRQAVERSPEKVGRYTVTGIPIVNEDEFQRLPPGAALVAIWQFRTSVLQRQRGYLERGGKLIFPLPGVEIVGEDYR